MLVLMSGIIKVKCACVIVNLASYADSGLQYRKNPKKGCSKSIGQPRCCQKIDVD
jgi:hypothetical protein